MKRKIGIDIHGVIDHDHAFFAELSQVLVVAGWEVHIMTGHLISGELERQLNDLGIKWTHLFSIAGYFIEKGDDVGYDEEGRPWMDTALWNTGKGEYAKEHNLDLVLDDTSEYAEHFTTSFAHCKIINKSGKIHRQKATMPEEFKNRFAKT
jgi:hypothetical protein